MPDHIKDNFQTSVNLLMSEKDMINYIKGLPVLLFRIEMVKNRIEYLNDCEIAGLGKKSFLLLKNRQVSQDIIFEDDFYLYESFINAVHEAKPALTVVRISDKVKGGFRWLKLIGSPNLYNPGYYLGMIVDITDSINLIEEMNRNEDEQQTMLELVDNPVILVDMKSRDVVSQNAAALVLFSYTFDEFNRLSLDDLLHPGFETEKAEIFEEIIFEKKWKGRMYFRRKGNAGFLGEASVRSLKIKERRLLRISIQSFDFLSPGGKNDTDNGSEVPKSESAKLYVETLMSKIGSMSDMKGILDMILNNPYGSQQFDGLIYSDIQIKKDRVVVYSAGETFRNLKQGESFSYEGTIAENIEDYKLDYLIVDDTMSSIKAIDWALFIPNGVRSYFAKPFFERNTLRSILILCSHEPDAFSEDMMAEYALLDKPFIKGLKNWRKALRSPKKS